MIGAPLKKEVAPSFCPEFRAQRAGKQETKTTGRLQEIQVRGVPAQA